MKRFRNAAVGLILCAALLLSLAGCAAKQKATATAIPIAYNAEAADYRLHIDASKEVHSISDMLYGAFFEDINFAADGGLYAEMVANRSFEFSTLAKDDSLYRWRTVGDAQIEVKTNDPSGALNPNNPSYLIISNPGSTPAGIENLGYLEGMAVSKQAYRFSLYAKAADSYNGGLTVCLTVNGKTVAVEKISALDTAWKKYSLTLPSEAEATEDVTLQILADSGSVAVDMISLFPENTYKGRENGMRADLAGLLEDMHPKFLRFPGGCVIEGFDKETAYDWKASVGADSNGNPLEFNGAYGDVAARRQGVNIWTDREATDDEYPSFMSYGLGFFEFFQLAEDIGAVGVPVLNAGMYCQSRHCDAVDINTPEFAAYIQDMLDLVEFCRGGANTKWGKVRVSLGHEAPFALKYIAIGNENEGEDYYKRYPLFLEALKRAKAEKPALYDGIELIYSSGLDDGLSGYENYLNSYAFAKEQLKEEKDASAFAGATDSHYYNDPQWFLKHADYYDAANYKRSIDEMTDTPFGGAIPVFLGEYASWSNNLNSALAEAAYMTRLESNGDIVKMASYAPLFSSKTARHWAPDLIWFDNHSAQPSVNYYIQKLFSENAGTALLSSTLDGAFIGNRDVSGKVGIGTWLTSAEFDNLKVTAADGTLLYGTDFSHKRDFKKEWEFPVKANLKVKNGRLVQAASKEERQDIGSVAFFGDSSQSNYTFSLDATKTGGEEGFFIPFAVKDSENAFFWNIGGYGNTVSCLQEIKNGIKSGQLEGTVKELVIEENKPYHLEIQVTGTNIKCYINGTLYVNYDTASTAEAEAYHVVSRDDSGNIIIKLVNVTNQEKTFALDIQNLNAAEGTAFQVAGDSMKDEAINGDEKCAAITEAPLGTVGGSFNYTVPKYSATVLRLSNKP